MNKLNDGLYVVLTAPFKENGEIDENGLRANIDWFLECGLNGIICTGSTGSFDTLTESEIKKVINITANQVSGKSMVLAGTSATSTKACIELSQYAESDGMNGLLIVPPFYCIPSEYELFEHYNNIAKSIKIPIIVYNNPRRTGVDMLPDFLIKLASDIENISYVKESSGDVNRIQQIVSEGSKIINVFIGSDDAALSALLMGAKGWIATCSNIIPEIALDLVKAVKKKNLSEAKNTFYKVLPLFEFIKRTGKYVQICKAGLEMRGKVGGTTRKPRLPITENEKAELRGYLKDLKLI